MISGYSNIDELCHHAITQKTGKEGHVLTFPGFGLGRGMYAPLEDRFPLLSYHHVELLHHGLQSTDSLGPAQPLPITEWSNAMCQYLDRLQGDICLVAYSIGARLVYPILLSCPQKVVQIVLIAPDGLFPQPLFQFATQTTIGQWAFKRIMRNPQHLKYVADRLAAGFPSQASTFKLASRQLRSPQHSQRVYHTWMAYRNFSIDPEKLIGIVRAHGISLYLVTGKRDTVIAEKKLRPLTEKLPANQSISLQAGHQGLPSVFFAGEAAEGIFRSGG